MESNPTEERPSSSQVISEDHAEASQQLKVERADISNMEIDPTETKLPSPQSEDDAEASQQSIESTDVSNMEIDSTETKVPPPGVDETNA